MTAPVDVPKGFFFFGLDRVREFQHDERTYKAGVDLHNFGKVADLSFELEDEKPVVSAKCWGSSDAPYTIKFTLEQTGKLASAQRCSCPQGERTSGHCKHVTAVMIAAHSALKNNPLLNTSNSPPLPAAAPIQRLDASIAVPGSMSPPLVDSEELPPPPAIQPESLAAPQLVDPGPVLTGVEFDVYKANADDWVRMALEHQAGVLDDRCMIPHKPKIKAAECISPFVHATATAKDVNAGETMDDIENGSLTERSQSDSCGVSFKIPEAYRKRKREDEAAATAAAPSTTPTATAARAVPEAVQLPPATDLASGDRNLGCGSGRVLPAWMTGKSEPKVARSCAVAKTSGETANGSTARSAKASTEDGTTQAAKKRKAPAAQKKRKLTEKQQSKVLDLLQRLNDRISADEAEELLRKAKWRVKAVYEDLEAETEEESGPVSATAVEPRAPAPVPAPAPAPAPGTGHDVSADDLLAMAEELVPATTSGSGHSGAASLNSSGARSSCSSGPVELVRREGVPIARAYLNKRSVREVLDCFDQKGITRIEPETRPPVSPPRKAPTQVCKTNSPARMERRDSADSDPSALLDDVMDIMVGAKAPQKPSPSLPSRETSFESSARDISTLTPASQEVLDQMIRCEEVTSKPAPPPVAPGAVSLKERFKNFLN